MPRLLRKKPPRFLSEYPEIAVNNREANRLKRFHDNYIKTTKYSPITFLPKNLFEQFRRTTNFYFLLIVIITLIPAISPLTPITAILPLVFVLGVSAIKEAYEDYVRYKADQRVNNAKYIRVCPGGEETSIRSMDIEVGDLIKINDDQPFPADICMLRSSFEDGLAYVETSSLDGETNLKTFKARPETMSMSIEQIYSLRQATFLAETPDHNLYSFKGALQLEPGDDKISISAEQLLLRGARLRNTPWAVGVVVYTGVNSKLSLNAKHPPSKFSTPEKILNKCVIVVFVFQQMLCLLGMIFAFWYRAAGPGEDNPYLMMDENAAVYAIKNFFSYFALLSFLIPMSLMVTLEVVKVFQSKFMEWDEEMALDRKRVEKSGMKAKTSNLNDELGLVQYIFSDKTGTLTENIMQFRKCCVNTTCYDSAGEGQVGDTLASLAESGREPTEDQQYMQEFLMCLAVCHGANAQVNEEDGQEEIVYSSTSPDEEALCQGAAVNGAVFISRTQEEVNIKMFGKEMSFQLLNFFDFSSSRARMSVIVRDPEGRIKVYSKGADAKMMPRLWASESDVRRKFVADSLEMYSKEGLRTLVLGVRELLEEEYAEWAKEWHTASVSMDNREELMEAATEKMESKLHLLGCTAIEDRLQRDVPETIHFLLEANIKLWMITGDKQETAINIGYSCKLLNERMDIVIVNTRTPEECHMAIKAGLDRVESLVESGKRVPDMGMVVNGGCLDWALSEYTSDFLDLAALCRSVIICRASPLQKSRVVKVVKEGEGAVTLSIGDGANDVSMIQEAHVGVGIYGREGSQAARNSDYAIREFRHLKRLIVVHGRYSLIRNAAVVQYSFYKNAAVFLSLFWFAFFSGFSGMTLYDDWIVTLFNIVFTSVPPFFIALFEKDIQETTIERFPQLFRPVQLNPYLTYASVGLWLLSAVWHSIVVFISCVLAFKYGVVFSEGQVAGLTLLGNTVAFVSFTVVTLKIVLETITWNVFVHIGIWGSYLIYIVFVFAESLFPGFVPSQYYEFARMLGMLPLWFLLFLCVLVCLGPEMYIKVWSRAYWPEDWQILQEFEWMTGGWRRKKDPKDKQSIQQLLGLDKMHSKMVEMTQIKRPKLKAFTKTFKRRFQKEKKKAEKYREQHDSGSGPEHEHEHEHEHELRVSAAHQNRQPNAIRY